MKLSVIILNYKVPYHLLLCLHSLKKSLHQIQSEIIVVDNNSEDESCELVREYFPDIILIENLKNEGFSKGNNHGVAIARGEYICLLNPDTAVSESVFKNVLQFAEMRTNVGAIGVQMIDGKGDFLPESKRNLPTFKVAFQKLMGNSEKYYAHHVPPDQNGKVEILPGAFMLMKKSRYLEVGGLDEDYFMYGEDIDLSYKFLKADYQNYYVGTETILHFKGESTVKNKIYAKRFYGAMQLFHQKHFNTNFVVNFGVKSGLKLAQTKWIFYSKNKSDSIRRKKSYLVSSNKNPRHLKDFDVDVISIKEAQNRKISNSIILFDVETVSFLDIFDTIQLHKNHENHFRFFLEKYHFFVGSDSSSTKGEVHYLD